MKAVLILISLCISVHFYGLSQTTVMGGRGANGEYIGFFQFLPDDYMSSSQKHPLIISLHGVGDKGNGTTELGLTECCGIPRYIKAGSKMKFSWNGKFESFIVLTPQLSRKYGAWQNFYVEELIKYAIRALRVDTNRIFLTGLSLGGGGTWSYASTSDYNARQLAGIIPVVAPCFVRDPCIIARNALPVYAIHSLDDIVAPASCTINTINSIINCKPLVTPNWTYYPNGGHTVFMFRAYDTAHQYQDPNVYEWMLAQNRRLPPNKKPIAQLTATASITGGFGLIMLDATKSYDIDGTLVRCSWQRLSGPQYGNMSALTPGLAQISGLTEPGIYRYLVKVVDDRAEWSTDTVAIDLTTAAPINQPPIANAGADAFARVGEIITLDAGGSSDPDGDIIRYFWSVVSGPEVTISNPMSPIAQVQNIQSGVYQFKLQILDNNGAISTALVTVTVPGDRETPGTTDPVALATAPAQIMSTIADPIFKEVINTTKSEEEANNTLFVYPNPATDRLFIRLKNGSFGNATINIYSVSGVLMRSLRDANGVNIPIDGLAPGIYEIIVRTPNQAMQRKKFVKL